MIDLTKAQSRTLTVKLLCAERKGLLSRIFKRNKKKVVEINLLPPTVEMTKELSEMSFTEGLSDAYVVLSKILSHNKECKKITVNDIGELNIDDMLNIVNGYNEWINGTRIEKN